MRKPVSTASLGEYTVRVTLDSGTAEFCIALYDSAQSVIFARDRIATLAELDQCYRSVESLAERLSAAIA
jgi:hypothetical protein